MSIITYPLNGITYTAENAETYLCTRTSGVYSSDDMFQASVTGDREVTISTGLAWINNGTGKGKSVYVDEDVAVTIPVADGSLPRIDRIVLQFSVSDNASSIIVVTGTPASSPVAPDIVQTESIYQLGLCTIAVDASSVSVNSGDITSTLLNEDVCGIMADGVTGIPTSELYEDFYAYMEAEKAAFLAWINAAKEDMTEYQESAEVSFGEWFDTIKGQLSEDAAGDLQNQINLISYYYVIENILYLPQTSTSASDHVLMLGTTTSEDTDETDEETEE